MTFPKADPLINFHDKARSRGFPRDISEPAMMRRLRTVNDLYQLGKLLQRAKHQGKDSDWKRVANEQKAAGNGDADRSGFTVQKPGCCEKPGFLSSNCTATESQTTERRNS